MTRTASVEQHAMSVVSLQIDHGYEATTSEKVSTGVRKLKCSGAKGDHGKCARCQRQNITCVFSAQKQMGRPKKRQQGDDEEAGNASTTKRRSRNTSMELDTEQNETMDPSIYESAFTPGGSLQPWLQDDWPTDLSGEGGHHGHGPDGGVPGLTPDSDSSIPMLGQPSSRNSSVGNAMLLDPTLASTSDHLNLGMPKCACLSTLYLTLNSLQTMDGDKFNFPFSLHPLREAMQTASTVLKCEECPKRFISGIQNTQLVGTLLMSIAERFSKVLEHISSESDRAERAGESKKFRLADLNTSTSHLHTGGLGCAATFEINLSPKEWRRMCKKVVHVEVYGAENGDMCCPHFSGICKQMEERQTKWHASPLPADFPRNQRGAALGSERDVINAGHGKDDHLCLKLVGFANRLVGAYDWS